MNDKVNCRTCVCCRSLKNKYTMVRVATSNGKTFLDSNFKSGGRGMYICSVNCLEKIASSKKFARIYGLISDKEIFESIKEVLEKND